MIHGASMGPTRGWQDPGWSHSDPMNLAIWVALYNSTRATIIPFELCITWNGRSHKDLLIFGHMGSLSLTKISWIGMRTIPDSKFRGANMGPTWVLSAPDGPHVGPMHLTIRGGMDILQHTKLGCSYRSIHALTSIMGLFNLHISYFILFFRLK